MPDTAFQIYFDDAIRLAVEYEPKCQRPGRIVIGAFAESFLASVDYWSQDDYRCQWREGVQRLLDGADRSCLMVNVSAPEEAHHFEWWPLYRRGDKVIFQNALLFLERIEGRFSFDRLYDHVPSHRSISDDGESISEWALDIKAMRAFVEAP